MKPSNATPVMLRYSEASGSLNARPDPSEYLRMTSSAPAEPTWFQQDFDRFAALAKQRERGFAMEWSDSKPCLDDRTSECGFDRHYIYHTAWAARVLARSRLARHVDISSSLYFSAIVSAFVPTEFYEFRQTPLQLD